MLQFNNKHRDILFNLDYNAIYYMSKFYNLVYGYDSNNLKNLKKFINEFHKMYNGEYPDMLETKLRTKFGDNFWIDHLDAKLEMPLYRLIEILIDESNLPNIDLSKYEFYSKVFQLKPCSYQYYTKHEIIINKMKESFMKRWNNEKNKSGVIYLRELDLILINLKFDKLYFEKVYFDISRYTLMNESVDYYIYCNFNVFLKKLRENGIINLEKIEIDQILKFNKADYSNINELMANTKQYSDDQSDKMESNNQETKTNKIDYASKFSYPNNETENILESNGYLCPLDKSGLMNGFGTYSCEEYVYIGYFSNNKFEGQGIIWVKNLNKFVYGIFTDGTVEKYHLLRDLNTFYDIIGDWNGDILDTQYGSIIKYDENWRVISVTRSSFLNMQAYGYTQVHLVQQGMYHEYFINSDAKVIFSYRMKQGMASTNNEDGEGNIVIDIDNIVREYQVGYVNDGYIEFYDDRFIRKGLFKGNKMDGWGVEIDLKNQVVYEGSFSNDRRSGYGQMIKGGDIYLGIFEGDTFNEVTYHEYSLKFEHILLI
eukprot:Mrub_01984.p1 GENE.Mrub_01984~~Mrub_01984.p1  ORF type:complete len:599 (+),score=82.40 Mrub_01984:175-1797(+)